MVQVKKKQIRQAILDSNAAAGSNVIEFDSAETAPYVIKPAGQFLPPLKGPVTVRMKPALRDGTTSSASRVVAAVRGRPVCQ